LDWVFGSCPFFDSAAIVAVVMMGSIGCIGVQWDFVDIALVDLDFDIAFDQGALNQEALNLEALNLEALNQGALNLEALNLMADQIYFAVDSWA